MAAIEISFHGMAANLSIEAAIERWMGRLESLCAIDHCTVAISRLALDDAWFRVALDVWCPDTASLLAVRESSAEHADIYVAVSNAFRANWRLLNSERPRPVRPATGVASARFAAMLR